MPELLENTIRVEILAHLVSACCRGDAEPQPNDLSDWIGKFMADSPAAPLEDPAEDLFVSCVNSKFGSFRIFQGNFGDAAFHVERLLAFFAEKPDFPTFQETIDGVLALLRLSDALAERVGLSRYSAGGGHAGKRIRLPRWRDLEPRVRSTCFTDADLQSLGITKSSLTDFFLSEEHRAKLTQEVMWGSSLERRPLLELENEFLVIEPSTLSRTAVRFMVERMRTMGGWGEWFYQQGNASIFVNDVRAHLQIEWIEFSRPTAEEGTPFMFPAFGAFDLGKPVIMLTYTPSLAGAADDFAGTDELTADEQSKFQRYVQACAAELEKLPGFSGGMVLVSHAGYGRGGGIGLAEWSPSWRVHLATLRDWLSLTADVGFTAMRLWKLGEHEAMRKRLGVELMNPAGLPNLVAFWERSGFRLVPQEMDIHEQHKMVVVECDFAQSVRVVGTQKRDEHCIQNHNGNSWVRVVRHNTRTIFPEDRDAPIYAAIDEARKRLIGCVKGDSVWWVTAPERPDRADLIDLLFQLWDCVLNWTNRLAHIAEREWPEIRGGSVDVRLVLPDLARWDHGRPGVRRTTTAELSTDVVHRDKSITITIPEGFLNHFNVPKNVAESRIVSAIIDGVARLTGDSAKPERIENLTREVMRNDDARYFHVVETHEIEQLLGTERRPMPLFVADEDTMLAQLGLADLAGLPSPASTITGREECQKFLQDTVTKIWERIEMRLRVFDRASVVRACFLALDEITRDEAHWDLTTRSLFALHDDHSETKRILRNRRSKRAAVNLGNRLLIETAQYACNDEGGRPFNIADHQSLLAEETLLTTFAHHRDAIAFGFLKPEVKIHPNGEIEVDEEFYGEIFSKYLSHRSDRASAEAAAGYEEHFESPEPISEEQSQKIDDKIAKLDEVFVPEFGFPIGKLVKFMELMRAFALKSKESGGQLKEAEMLGVLQGCGFSLEEANAFLERLTLPIRAAWDSDLPTRCKKEDVYPWRFRRHLSLLLRPLVQVSASPRTWCLSAPFFQKSANYLTVNIERADLPERFFGSEKMRTYIGQQVNRRGHSFAERVRDVFVEKGFASKLEIEMSELGAPKSQGLGDIDVLAWNTTNGKIFPVECKRLLPALTVREVLQRLEDFRGDKKAKDSLGRHLRRVDWLNQNLESLTKLTGILKENIKMMPVLVTSDIVPMQFFEQMNFPSKQVVPFDDLGAYLSR